MFYNIINSNPLGLLFVFVEYKKYLIFDQDDDNMFYYFRKVNWGVIFLCRKLNSKIFLDIIEPGLLLLPSGPSTIDAFSTHFVVSLSTVGGAREER